MELGPRCEAAAVRLAEQARYQWHDATGDFAASKYTLAQAGQPEER